MSRNVLNEMSALMLEGYALTADACPLCNGPILRARTGAKRCVSCESAPPPPAPPTPAPNAPPARPARSRSDTASARIGQQLLSGARMLAEGCARPGPEGRECGVPLMRARGSEVSTCVICDAPGEAPPPPPAGGGPQSSPFAAALQDVLARAEAESAAPPTPPPALPLHGVRVLPAPPGWADMSEEEIRQQVAAAREVGKNLPPPPADGVPVLVAATMQPQQVLYDTVQVQRLSTTALLDFPPPSPARVAAVAAGLAAADAEARREADAAGEAATAPAAPPAPAVPVVPAPATLQPASPLPPLGRRVIVSPNPVSSPITHARRVSLPLHQPAPSVAPQSPPPVSRVTSPISPARVLDNAETTLAVAALEGQLRRERGALISLAGREGSREGVDDEMARVSARVAALVAGLHALRSLVQ